MNTFNWVLLSGLFASSYGFTFGTIRGYSQAGRMAWGVSTGTTAPAVTDRHLANSSAASGAYYYASSSYTSMGSIATGANITDFTGIRVNFWMVESVGNASGGVDRTYREAGLFMPYSGTILASDKAPANAPSASHVLIARSLFATPYPVKNASTRLNFQWDINIA